MLENILENPLAYSNHQTLFILFSKVLNQIIFSLFNYIEASDQYRQDKHFLQFLSLLLELFPLLFKILYNFLLSDQRVQSKSSLFQKVFSRIFTEHRIKGFVDPVIYFLSVTFRHLLPFTIISMICQIFLKISGSSNPNSAKSSKYFTQMQVCKFHFRELMSIYLAVFPRKSPAILKYFLETSESKTPSSLGLAFFNEIIRKSSQFVKGRKIQYYIQSYCDLKNHSDLLDRKSLPLTPR